jgi:diaminopimelate decarboxylase
LLAAGFNLRRKKAAKSLSTRYPYYQVSGTKYFIFHISQLYSVIFLEEAHIEAVMRVSIARFGTDFLSEAELRTYLDSTTHFCQVFLQDGEVLGFSLMEVGDCEQIARRMKGQADWFLRHFAAYERLAYRSLTAVAKEAEGRGVATALVREGLAFLATRAEVVVCDAWKSDHTHIGGVLERNGYALIKEVPDYWAADSQAVGYTCCYCGAPPCRCTAVIYAKFFARRYWWQRQGLAYEAGELHFAGRNLRQFVANKATPFYLYDLDRIVEKYGLMSAALTAEKADFCIYYALKANRNPAILSHLRLRTTANIDVCSPNELIWALQNGFEESQISYTGTSLSDSDLQILASYQDIKINFDSISAMRRFARYCPTRNIGIRINPHIGMAYKQSLEYSGNDVVKFGIYREQWADLVAFIRDSDFVVDTVHCHAGSGFLSPQLSKLAQIFAQIDDFIQLFPTIRRLNLGGGLGVPQEAGDKPLDLAVWAKTVADYARARNLSLAFEPGDFLVKDAGLLIAQVNTVEMKKDRLFLAINAGMNINYEYAYYQMNLEPVPLVAPTNDSLRPTTIAGNINEPIDLFAENKLLPHIEEGDFLALLGAGGYGASTSSNHCMRGDFKEYVISNNK